MIPQETANNQILQFQPKGGLSVFGAKGKGGGGGGSYRAPIEYPNTLQSRSIARLIDLLCEGEIRGLVNGLQSIFLDDTPLENPDGSRNFHGITVETRNGTPSQAHMSGFPEIESEFNVGAEIRNQIPVIRYVENANSDAVRIKIKLDGLYYQELAEGQAGDMKPHSVTIAIDLNQNHSSWYNVITNTISGKTTSPYERAFRINLPKGGHPWGIRVRRISADDAQSTHMSKTHFSSFTTIIDSKLTYPDSAYVGITVDARLFGSNVPQRSYEIYGQIIDVPSNYDPVKRTYTGIWNGSFKRAYSDNPAWCFYDLITNPRFGLGREIPKSRIDKMGLYQIAQYCDELVPDGRGGQEPRFTFNGGIYTRDDAVKVLALMAGVFRGMVYYAGDMLYVAQDRPTGYKRLLTPANVVDGVFNYEGSSLRARHTVSEVIYLEPEEGYKSQTHVVEDADAIRKFGVRTKEGIAPGCTSQGQADRQGRMELDIEQTSTDVVTFATGLDCFDIMPGDVVAIADPYYAGKRMGGRLVSITKTRAKLDDQIEFLADIKYILNVILPDNELMEIPLVNPQKNTDEVEFAQPIERLPLEGSIYIVLASNLEPRLFRILSIQEGDGITHQLGGILYDPDRFDRVELGITLPPRPTSNLPTGPIQTPFNLSAREYLYLFSNSIPRSAVVFSWQTNDPRIIAYEVQVWYPSSYGWTDGFVVGSFSVDIQDTTVGHYKFRVRSVDALGRYSPWAEFEIDLMGMYAPPADVTGFLSQTIGSTMQLSWNQVLDLDLSHYEIRYSSLIDGSPTWETSQFLVRAGKYQTSAVIPTRPGTYFIKAVDVVDVFSVNAAAIINEISNDLFNMNVLRTFPQHYEWLGVKDRVALVDINGPKLVLRIDPETGCFYEEGYYYFDPPEDNLFDLGGVYLSYVETMLKAGGYNPDYDFFDPIDFFALEDFFDHNKNHWRAVIEMRVTDDPPNSLADFFDFADFFEMPDFFTDITRWSAWQPITAQDVKARAFQFRIKLNSLDCMVTPAIELASVSVDMPDRLSSDNDLVVLPNPEGHRVLFHPAFMAPPAIAVTIQEGFEGDIFQIRDKDRFGYTILIFDRSGEQVSRKIDGIYKGYGAQIDYIMPGVRQ